jgi:hypothetical protein
MKIYNGTNWQDAKSLKIHNGSSWSSAIKGWVYNGGWQLSYPNSPVSLSGPTFTHSGTTYMGMVGAILTASSSWNSDPAYAPSSYTYEWKRGSSPISGATSQTYTATVADIDQNLSCTITATNARGSTVITGSIGTVILPVITMMNAYDATATPSQPSVSISSNNLDYSGSWTSSSNATLYSVTTNNGSVTPSGQTFTGSGTGGSVTVSVTPANTNKQVYIYWGAAAGASSYDIVKFGNNVQTTINVPSSTTNYTWSIADGNEGNYFSVYPRSSLYQGYGIQTTVTVSNKTGTAGTATTTLIATPPPSAGSISLTPSGTQMAGVNITAATSGWSGSPTAYEIKINKAPGTPAAEGGSVVSEGVVSGTSVSHIITSGEAAGTPDQFTAFARAYNNGGWSSWIQSNTVTSTPYVAPVVIPSGGAASLSPSGTVQARNTISAATSGWSQSPTSYEIQIRKQTGSSPADENSGTQVATSASSATSYTITDAEAAGTPDQFAAFARAYNSGGWSSWSKSNTVTSTPYVAPVVVVTAPGTPTLSFAWISGLGTASSPSSWTSSWSDGGGGTPTSWEYELQLGNTSSGPSLSSDAGTLYSRSKNYNSYSYSYSQFRVRAYNSGGYSAWTAWSGWK